MIPNGLRLLIISHEKTNRRMAEYEDNCDLLDGEGSLVYEYLLDRLNRESDELVKYITAGEISCDECKSLFDSIVDIPYEELNNSLMDLV